MNYLNNRTVIIFAYEDVFYVSMWMKNRWEDLVKYDRPINVY